MKIQRSCTYLHKIFTVRELKKALDFSSSRTHVRHLSFPAVFYRSAVGGVFRKTALFITIRRSFKDVHVNSFFHRTARRKFFPYEMFFLEKLSKRLLSLELIGTFHHRAPFNQLSFILYFFFFFLKLLFLGALQPCKLGLRHRSVKYYFYSIDW